MSYLEPVDRPAFLNVPNAVTLVRTVASMVLTAVALVEQDLLLLGVAYAVYWAGDMLDGFMARRLDQETRLGAVFDVVSDRACCALAGAALLTLRPGMVLPLTIFLIQFLVIDTMLTLSFLYWPIISPNYFSRVHTGVYRWNWSPPAKAVNTSGAVLLILFSPTVLWPALFVTVVAVVKVVSSVVVGRLLLPRERAAVAAPA
jgi:phosphatidylglycerophosphate synthase